MTKDEYIKILRKRHQKLQEKAEKHLSGPRKEYCNILFNSKLEAMKKQYKKEIEAERNLFDKIADFQFENDREFYQFACSDVKTISNFFDRGFGDSFDKYGNFGFDLGFLAEGRIFEDFNQFKEDLRIIDTDAPIIMSFPDEIKIWRSYTIHGHNFGNIPGKIEIEVFEGGPKFEAIIREWSNYAIKFDTSEDQGGISFNSRGRLTITRGDMDKSKSVFIDIEPYIIRSTFKETYEKSGFNRDFSAYSKTKIFKSPPLPTEYTLHESDHLEKSGLHIFFTDGPSSLPWDDHAKYEVISGPLERNNRLEVKIKITDDSRWNYLLEVMILINLPLGFEVDGWDNQS